MSLFDLLFIAAFLTAVGSLAWAAIGALRGRPARPTLARLGIGAAIYFTTLILTSLFTPQRVLPMGAEQCNDDWCIAVQSATHADMPAGTAYDVTLRVSSRARRVPQRERFVTVFLRDAEGRRYDTMADAHAVPFDTLLQPGESVDAVRRFVVPRDAGPVGLVVTRDGGGRFPGCCIIAEEASLFHKRTIVPLD